jgi:hypothetical protein
MMPQAFKPKPFSNIMQPKQEANIFGIFGLLLVAQTFLDFAPAGPWDSRSFSRGVVGLLGVLLLYLSWFRFTFDKKGVAPVVTLWKNPKSSSTTVIIFGFICLVFTKFIVNSKIGESFPQPAGLVITFIGLLAIANGIYVWLISAGPLAVGEEENNDVEIKPENNDAETESKNSEDDSNNPVNVTYNIQNIEIHDSVVTDSKFTNEEE